MKDMTIPHELSVAARGTGAPRLADHPRPIVIDFDDLRADTDRISKVPHVLAWLYCGRYDVMDVADRLSRAGYRGHLTAVCRPLPKKTVVEREIRKSYPRISFSVEMDENAGVSNPYEASLRRTGGAGADTPVPLEF